MTFTAVYFWGGSCEQCPVDIGQIVKGYEFITFWMLKKKKKHTATYINFILELTIKILHSKYTSWHMSGLTVNNEHIAKHKAGHL
jgi:hypothetical protein